MRRPVVTAVLAGALVLAASGPASASAYYNRVSTSKPNPAKVHLSCGIFCASTFKIAPGGHASRPGKGGSFILANEGDFTDQDTFACQTLHNSIGDHGWATLEDPDARYEWYVFAKGGSQVKGSPFVIRFTECNLP